MRKGTKRLLALAMAGAMTFSGLALNGGEKGRDAVYAADSFITDSASDINFATILGGAIDYGMVADHIIQRGHMETTFTTNSFAHNGTANEVDYMDSDKTAHFIIGGIDNENGDGRIALGHTTAKNFYIEATSEVFEGYDGTTSNVSGGPNGHFIFMGDLENSSTEINKI